MNYRDPSVSTASIKRFSWRAYRRLLAAGDRSLSREDIEQELWCAWCIAVEAYDVESGVPFLAYLMNGMRMHINRYIEKHVERRSDEVRALSLDMPMGDEGNGGSFGEIVPSNESSPLDRLMDLSALNYANRYLSEKARLFIRLLHDQPDFLLKEVRAVSARADYARSHGTTIPFANRITSAMVFDLLGIPTADRGAILREISKVGDRVRRVEA